MLFLIIYDDDLDLKKYSCVCGRCKMKKEFKMEN